MGIYCLAVYPDTLRQSFQSIQSNSLNQRSEQILRGAANDCSMVTAAFAAIPAILVVTFVIMAAVTLIGGITGGIK
jgi:hypothetical protein